MEANENMHQWWQMIINIDKISYTITNQNTYGCIFMLAFVHFAGHFAATGSAQRTQMIKNATPFVTCSGFFLGPPENCLHLDVGTLSAQSFAHSCHSINVIMMKINGLFQNQVLLISVVRFCQTSFGQHANENNEQIPTTFRCTCKHVLTNHSNLPATWNACVKKPFQNHSQN